MKEYSIMKLITLTLAVVFSVFVLGGCGGGGSRGATLSGVVVDGPTGVPLPGVRVALGTASTTTGSNGSFILTGLSVGSGVLTAQFNGYEISSMSVTIESGANSLEEPILMAPTTGEPPDVSPRTIEGTITLSGESNASGVTVSLLSGITLYEQVTTSSDGRYHFWASIGTYTVRAEKTGFVTKEQAVSVTDMTKVVTVNLTMEQS